MPTAIAKAKVQAAPTIEQTLQRLGHSQFREGQERAIRHLLDGHNVLVVLPSGSGKSLIYQLAALHLPDLTLVVSPLIALMQDQVEKLVEQGVPAAYINSTLSDQELEAHLRRMTAGEYKIVYVTPERLRQACFQEQMQDVKVSLLAVDEAHSISVWGHDFRPDYLHIADFRHFAGDPPTVALTATATRRVQDEILALLELSDVRRIRGGFDRPNIKFAVDHVSTEDDADEAKLARIDEIFSARPGIAAIVYTGTRKEAERVAAHLRTQHEIRAEHYHAGLSGSKRTAIQDAFMAGELPVVAATNAFGMGIDRPDVRLVLHYTIPGSLEAYYQEAGRAGRDGKPAEAILLYNENDRRLHEHFIRQGELSYRELESLYEQLVAALDEQGVEPEAPQIDIQQLGRQAQVYGGDTKVRVALEHLETAGVIAQGLYEGRELEFVPHGWDADAVRAAVEETESRSRWQLQQLEEMLYYAENRLDCRRGILLAHFGDEARDEVRSDCCDICAGKREVAEFVAEIEAEAEQDQPPAPPPPLRETILDSVREFDALRTPLQIVDLLHGDEKGYNRFKNSPYHGMLEAYTREEIQAEIDGLLASSTLTLNELERLTVAGV